MADGNDDTTGLPVMSGLKTHPIIPLLTETDPYTANDVTAATIGCVTVNINYLFIIEFEQTCTATYITK